MGKGRGKKPGGSRPPQSGESKPSGLHIVRKQAPPPAVKPVVVTIDMSKKQPPKKEEANPVEKEVPVQSAASKPEENKPPVTSCVECPRKKGKEPEKKQPIQTVEKDIPVQSAASPVAPAPSAGKGPGKKGRQLDDDVLTKAVIPKDPAPKNWLRIDLDTNYFHATLNSSVYEYGITFEPSLGDSPKRKSLVHKRKIPGTLFVMGNCLYTFTPIPENDLEWTVSAREAGLREDVDVILNLANTFKEGLEVPNRVFAAIMQQSLSNAGYKHIQRNFFDFSRIQRIPGGKYIVIPGIELAVVPTMKGSSLVADVTNKVARTGSVLSMWKECKSDKERDWLCKDFVKMVVYTNYNNRSYTVKCVRKDMKPSSEFVLADGMKISYAKYVQTRYGKVVSTDLQPMLECERRGESVFIIPEFCQPTGFDDADRRDFKLMSEITKALFPEPKDRQAMISKEVTVISKNTKSVDLTLSSSTKVSGYLIPCPKLPSMKARDNLSRGNAKVMAGGKTINRLVVVAGNRFDPSQLIDTVTESLANIGLTHIEVIEVEFGRGCEKEIQKARPDFVLFVSPFGKDQDYRQMKMMCTHELKVPSQVVTERNLKNPKRAYTVILNVARQMAVKLGKCPWVMPFKSLTPDSEGTQVFGLDVCHTTPIHKSVVGMVASYDDTFGKYVSDFIVQDRGKEIVGDLRPFVERALGKYKKKNGKYPRNVLFLRDGVGDGQLMYVNDVEMTAIGDVIKAVSPSTRLTFVVVKKRIRTRLFSSGGNPKPGTLVDDCITHPGWYDFFLVSHETRNGTVSPTHYNVLLDGMKWPKSELQLFIYLLCYQYYNWDGSISVPAPCQYAHKMAFLYGRTLLSSPDHVPRVPAELEETLPQI